MTVDVAAGRLLLTPSQARQLEAHAAAAYPEECCGILLGRATTAGEGRLVERVLPAENARRERRHDRYVIPPESLLEAQRLARGAGLEVVGYYHSHPDRPARPSAHDREHAWPGTSYVIVGVERGRPAAITSWRLSAERDGFEEEAVAETVAGAPLSAAEVERYGRHLVMPEVGPAGQERLKASRVLVVGAGGLGSPLGLYLAAAGVGTLGLVDFDTVEASNLHRQVLYGESDVGRPKLQAAVERLRDVNPHVEIVPHELRLDAANALDLLRGYDVVVDGSDNFPTRYLVNDACVLLGKPDVYGAIHRFEGQVAVFWGARGPCYRCLFAEPPPPGLVPSCSEGGVLGVLPGIVGALQANEAIKLVLGIGEPLVGRLLLFDALRLRFHEVALRKNPGCPVCSEHPTQRELIDYERFCGAPAAEPEGPAEIDVTVGEVRRWRDEGRPFVLLDVRTPREHAIARIVGARLIPLHELPRRLGELDPAASIVVHCHLGPRSAQATRFLRRAGFEKTWNLRGGIDAWSREVDPAVPRY